MYKELANVQLDGCKRSFVFSNSGEWKIKVALEPWAAEIDVNVQSSVEILLPEHFDGHLEFAEYQNNERLIGANADFMIVILDGKVVANLPEHFPEASSI
ncbi:MAG: hypothetical protein AAGA09_01720 [Pseudomonadota bacterium]